MIRNPVCHRFRTGIKREKRLRKRVKRRDKAGLNLDQGTKITDIIARIKRETIEL